MILPSQQLTFAVTAFNESTRGRFSWIRQCIDAAVGHPLVGSIVIVNDGTEDYTALCQSLAGVPKVSLYQNPENYGVFGNKLEAVFRSVHDWVLLCDSDNTMNAAYLDRLASLMPWDERTFYSASFARPQFDYRGVIGSWAMSDVAHLWKHPNFGCFVNTGNQLLHRPRFLEIFGKYRGPRFDLLLPNYFKGVKHRAAQKRWRVIYDAADSFFINKEWWYAGNRLAFVDGLEYEHRVDNSSWQRAPGEKEALTPAFVLEMLDRIEGRPPRPYLFASRWRNRFAFITSPGGCFVEWDSREIVRL